MFAYSYSCCFNHVVQAHTRILDELLWWSRMCLESATTITINLNIWTFFFTFFPFLYTRSMISICVRWVFLVGFLFWTFCSLRWTIFVVAFNLMVSACHTQTHTIWMSFYFSFPNFLSHWIAPKIIILTHKRAYTMFMKSFLNQNNKKKKKKNEKKNLENVFQRVNYPNLQWN